MSHNKGQIKLDGIDLKDIDTQYLRDHIGLGVAKKSYFPRLHF